MPKTPLYDERLLGPGTVSVADIVVSEDPANSVIIKIVELANSGVKILSSVNQFGGNAAPGTGLVTLGVDMAYINANETDPVFTSSAAYGITGTDISHWNTAYGWGDHSVQGYIKTDTNFANTDLTATANREHDFGGHQLYLYNTAFKTYAFNPGITDARIETTQNSVVTKVTQAQYFGSSTITSGVTSVAINAAYSQPSNSGNSTLTVAHNLIELKTLGYLTLTHGTTTSRFTASGNFMVGSTIDNGQKLQVAGGASVASLAGTGSRMVTADANGVLSTQAIPSSTDTNFATTDLSFTGDRTHDLLNHTVDFNNVGYYQVTAGSSYNYFADGSMQYFVYGLGGQSYHYQSSNGTYADVDLGTNDSGWGNQIYLRSDKRNNSYFELRNSAENTLHQNKIAMDSTGIQMYSKTPWTDVAKPFWVLNGGNLRAEGYPSSRDDGATTKALYVDASGNIKYGTVTASGGGTSYTFSNGLTNTSGNVGLGGTLTADTTISTGGTTLFLTGGTSANGTLNVTSTSSQRAISAINSSTGYAIGAVQSGNGTPLFIQKSDTGTNDVRTAIEMWRIGGTVTNGFGQKIIMSLENSSGGVFTSNEIITKWTDATSGTHVSQFEITGQNAGTLSTLFTLKGAGQLQLNKYGVNTFTGTAAYYLAVDASGNVIETAAPSGGGTTYTFSNGLTNTSGAVTLGGNLTQDTTINTTTSYSLKVNGTNTSTLGAFQVTATTSTGVYSQNNGGGHAVYGNNFGSGYGVYGQSQTGAGVYAEGKTTTPLKALLTIPTSTNTVMTILDLSRSCSGGIGGDGIGASIDISNRTSAQGQISNRLISKWTTATEASRTSQFEITGVNSAVTATLFTLKGSGQLQLNKYGVNTFSGTAVYYLGVDASGNIVETSGSGGGSSTPSYSMVEMNDADYTVASGVTHVYVSKLTANRTLTLPSASSNTNRKIIVKHGGGNVGGTWVVNYNVSVVENFSTSGSTLGANKFHDLISNGTDWVIVANN